MKSNKQVSVDTFADPSNMIENLRFKSEPYVFNRVAYLVKYRVTVEVVDESVETMHARLIEVWETSSNRHDRDPLKEMAAKYDLTLDWQTFGSRRNK